MKSFFLLIVLALSLVFIIIFSPIPIIIDKVLVTEKKVNLWKKYARDGNITAISNLIWFYENKNKIEADKWFSIYKKEREKRRKEYLKK